MNFLAHTFLSCQDEKLLVGNFLGDFVSNRQVPQFEDRIREGIMLHRKIDRYTDDHPLVRQAMKRLYADHHKYASVLVDVFYDYCLSNNWDRYAEESLPDFAQRIYGILMRFLPIMPTKMHDRLPRMIEDDWLCGYQELAGIERTLHYLKRRVSKPEYLEGALDSLIRDRAFLYDEFNEFFPEVIAFVNAECFCD